MFCIYVFRSVFVITFVFESVFIYMLLISICVHLERSSLRVDCRHEMWERVLLTIGHQMYSRQGRQEGNQDEDFQILICARRKIASNSQYWNYSQEMNIEEGGMLECGTRTQSIQWIEDKADKCAVKKSIILTKDIKGEVSWWCIVSRTRQRSKLLFIRVEKQK